MKQTNKCDIATETVPEEIKNVANEKNAYENYDADLVCAELELTPMHVVARRATPTWSVLHQSQQTPNP